MPPGGSNTLLTTQECADYLNVPLRTLRDRRQHWGLPAVRVGRALRFRVRDVDSWLDRHAVSPQPAHPCPRRPAGRAGHGPRRR